MPVTVTVSEVRTALLRAAGQNCHGDGSPSTAELGRWFHEGLRQLLGSTGPRNPLAELAELDTELELWKRSLTERMYSEFVGPRLSQYRAALHDDARQVFDFWRAMQAACDWLAELAWSVRPKHAPRGTSAAPAWPALNEWIASEEPLTCELKEPGWTDSVHLVGIADAVIRLPENGVWCAMEFKLGSAAPVVDLGQACLYHLMLSATESRNGHDSSATPAGGSLALISFRPERHEHLFSADELGQARQRLIDLIGKLAGVDSVQQVAPEGRTGPTRDSIPAASRIAGSMLVLQPSEDHIKLGEGLVKTLAEYGVQVTLSEPPIVGPTFLRFPIELGRGMRVNSVESRSPELQVRLGLIAEPFINRENGQLVIDIQRPDRQVVSFEDVRTQLPAPDPKLGGSHVPIGVDLGGQLTCANLATTQHCHLLAAGTTGSGKSEWLRLAIAGLICTNTPETLRLLIIDPKRNAFHALRDSPYLWRPLVFPDEQSAGEVLRELAEEMERRYRHLDGADSHAQLAKNSDIAVPRIVCVCDEYRDLIMRSREEQKLIEQQINRLGAKARAAGIHLILATQEPRRETIKGPLDANIPARVGLKMQKAQESRMLLSESGAEKLLGHGDLLFKDTGRPRRLQAPYLDQQSRMAIFGQT